MQYIQIDVHVDHIHIHNVLGVNEIHAAVTAAAVVIIIVGKEIAVVGERFPQQITAVGVAVVVAVVVVLLAASVAAAAAATPVVLMV